MLEPWRLIVAIVLLGALRQILSKWIDESADKRKEAQKTTLALVSRVPWGALLLEYFLLLAGCSLIGWGIGWVRLNRLDDYVPRLLVIPVGIMLLRYCFKKKVRSAE